MIVNLFIHYITITIPGYIFILILGIDGIYIEDCTIFRCKQTCYRHFVRNILNHIVLTIIGFHHIMIQRLIGQACLYHSLINIAASRRYPLIVAIYQTSCL